MSWQPGAQSPSVESARYQVRHEIRDGMPALDANPTPFEMVRLEDLSDQIVQQATPASTQFQLRFQNVPLEQYATVYAVPGTLVAYVDGWTPTPPTVDVDRNGNFTLPVAPVASLKITYGWQYFLDQAIDNFVDQARQWLREYTSVTLIPDGLNPALVHYASALALRALGRQLTLAMVRGGDAEIDLSALAKAYTTQADALEKTATAEREAYYSRGPEPLAPTATLIGTHQRPWTPQR